MASLLAYFGVDAQGGGDLALERPVVSLCTLVYIFHFRVPQHSLHASHSLEAAPLQSEGEARLNQVLKKETS
jgi:hypothetical protein